MSSLSSLVSIVARRRTCLPASLSASSSSSISSFRLSPISSSSTRSSFSTQPQPNTESSSSSSSNPLPFHTRRAKYKKAVSSLRKQYALEISRQQKLDLESQQKQKAIITRKRLERQRLKNIQSTKNALKQEQLRIQAKADFEHHLIEQQVKRSQREERFVKAKKIVVDELEQQADYWMTSREEVDVLLCNTRNPNIDQELWTRPASYVGEPAPSNDASFWRYESHTWKVQKTYQTPKDKLLQEIQEGLYDHANIDYNLYWSKERVAFQLEKEEKAKLRALVLNEGKKVLLQKQRRLMQDVHATQKHENTTQHIVPPKLDAPVPSTDILANYEAMEMEGVNLLREDPTKFFVFDDNQMGDNKNEDDNNSNARGDATTTNENTNKKSKSLGTPIRLVDPVRDASFTNTPYPELLGRLPKPDLRTEREKKKQEREERMLAAAALAKDADSNEDDNEIEDDIENQLNFGMGALEKDADYEEMANRGDEIDQEWEEGLDPVLDKELFEMPFDERFTENDIDYMIEKLEQKVNSLKEIISLEQEGQDQDSKLSDDNNATSEEDANDDPILDAMGPNTVKTTRIDEKGREVVSYDVLDDADDDDMDIEDYDDIMSVIASKDNLNDLIQMQDKSNVLKTLNDEQMAALQSLEDDDSGDSKTEEEIKDALKTVPGLTDTQLQALVDLELSLMDNDLVQSKLKGKK